MCRSIKVLRRAGEPVTPEELDAAALQFVRKISGTRKPSRANQEAFDRGVREVSAASRRLLDSMSERAPVRALRAEKSAATPPVTI